MSGCVRYMATFGDSAMRVWKPLTKLLVRGTTCSTALEIKVELKKRKVAFKYFPLKF